MPHVKIVFQVIEEEGADAVAMPNDDEAGEEDEDEANGEEDWEKWFNKENDGCDMK